MPLSCISKSSHMTLASNPGRFQLSKCIEIVAEKNVSLHFHGCQATTSPPPIGTSRFGNIQAQCCKIPKISLAPQTLQFHNDKITRNFLRDHHNLGNFSQQAAIFLICRRARQVIAVVRTERWRAINFPKRPQFKPSRQPGNTVYQWRPKQRQKPHFSFSIETTA